MRSTMHSRNLTLNANMLLNVSCGLLFGIVLGMVIYWILHTNESKENAIFSIGNHVNTSNNGSESGASSWTFAEEFDHSDLQTLIEMLANLNQQELLDLIEKSATQSGTKRLYTIQELLIENLVQISPEAAVASVEHFQEDRRRALLQHVFLHWSLVDLESAISAADELKRSDRQEIVKAIFTERSDLNEQNWTSMALKTNFESELAMWESEREVYQLMDQEPAAAIQLLVDDNTDDFQQIDLYREVVEQWFQFDGLNVLKQLQHLDLPWQVLKELVEQVTQKDRVATLNFLHRRDFDQYGRIENQLVTNWVEHDAADAFRAVNDLPKSQYRNSLLLTVILAWGRKHPSEALDRVMEFPRLYRADAVSAAAIKLAEDNPLATIDRISDFRSVPGTNVDRAIESVVRNWALDAPKLALEWVQNNTEEGSTYRAELLGEVLPKYALDEPEQAMTIAVEEFNPDSIYSSLESQVIRSLITFDRLDSAVELLPRVRDEFRRLESVNVGAELVKQNRLDDALALTDSIPNEERSEYLYWLASRLTIYDLATDVLELIAKVPSAQLQSTVAERLLTDGTAESDFTADQIETLRSFVRE